MTPKTPAQPEDARTARVDALMQELHADDWVGDAAAKIKTDMRAILTRLQSAQEATQQERDKGTAPKVPHPDPDCEFARGVSAYCTCQTPEEKAEWQRDREEVEAERDAESLAASNLLARAESAEAAHVRLSAIRQREREATAGPWVHWQGYDQDQDFVSLVKFPDGEDVSMLTMQNAEFIAHARADVPWLLDRIQRLERERIVLVSERDRLRGFRDGVVEGSGSIPAPPPDAKETTHD